MAACMSSTTTLTWSTASKNSPEARSIADVTLWPVLNQRCSLCPPARRRGAGRRHAGSSRRARRSASADAPPVSAASARGPGSLRRSRPGLGRRRARRGAPGAGKAEAGAPDARRRRHEHHPDAAAHAHAPVAERGLVDGEFGLQKVDPRRRSITFCTRARRYSKNPRRRHRRLRHGALAVAGGVYRQAGKPALLQRRMSRCISGSSLDSPPPCWIRTAPSAPTPALPAGPAPVPDRS